MLDAISSHGIAQLGKVPASFSHDCHRPDWNDGQPSDEKQENK